MLPVSLVPVIPVTNHAKAVYSQSLPTMPPSLIELIASYTATSDYSRLYQTVLEFDTMGRVTNPALRDAIKEVFMSSYCSSDLKSALMRHVFAAQSLLPTAGSFPAQYFSTQFEFEEFTRYFTQIEFEVMFKEIALAGYKAIFDFVDLSGLTLIDITWTNVSLRSAKLNAATVTNVDMCGADLTDATLDYGCWTDVNVDNAIFSGTNPDKLLVSRRVNWRAATGLASIPDPSP